MVYPNLKRNFGTDTWTIAEVVKGGVKKLILSRSDFNLHLCAIFY